MGNSREMSRILNVDIETIEKKLIDWVIFMEVQVLHINEKKKT